MELILFIGEDCDPCHKAEDAFKKKYAKELESGEATIVNLDDASNEQAQKFWIEHELPLAPVCAVITENEQLIAVIEADKLLPDIPKAEPEPTAEGPVQAAVESSGDNPK